jgi:general secretion pathway protein H
MDSVGGRPPARSSAGLTLIEVLVVVAIIGVLSVALALVGSPGEATLARKEARRLAALIELALAETRASGKSLAWSYTPEGYAFFRQAEDGEWSEVEDDGALGRRSLPSGTAVDGARVGESRLAPREYLVLSPHGLGEPFEATIAGGLARFTLRAGPLRRVTLLPESTSRNSAPIDAQRPRLHAG